MKSPWCVVLRFTDAKIFPDATVQNSKACSKDSSYGIDSLGKQVITPRNKTKNVKVQPGTLYVKHISNAMHVLMGERPTPSFRGVNTQVMKQDQSIMDYAKNALIEIETPVLEMKEQSKETKAFKLEDITGYPRELMTVRKTKTNSWKMSKVEFNIGTRKVMLNDGDLTWDRLVAYLGFELYAELHMILIQIEGPDYLKSPITEVISKHGNKPVFKNFTKKCRDNSKISTSHLFDATSNQKIEFGRAQHVKEDRFKYRPLNQKGIERVSCISGRIYIPIDEIGRDRFLKGNGFASILEGGSVYIEQITRYSDTLVSGAQNTQLK